MDVPSLVKSEENILIKSEPLMEQDRLAKRPKSRKDSRRKRRGRHLWEFLLDVLHNPAHNPKLIKWVDQEKQIFKIEKSQDLAKLWGQRKSKDTMTYEYMSRAMRHYYNKGIMRRVFGKRLVYQFGEKAKSWQADALD